MEEPGLFRLPKEKARLESVAGHTGKALRFSFDDEAKGAFIISRLTGTPEWDRAAGLSFWLQGDGSDHFGNLQLIWNEDYAIRYDCAFPLKNKEWHQVVIPWRDFVAVLPKGGPLDPKGTHAPSKISAVWFGKWWYWRDTGAHTYAMDDLMLEKEIALPPDAPPPAGSPLARVRAKIAAGKPVTVVTMGDSLTDERHWTNRGRNWPGMFKEALEGRATIVNPAIGGTELRQNLVLVPLWRAQAPEPDLVTILFGGNDWGAGMRGPMFQETMAGAIDRVRRATGGKADVLVMTPCPSLEQWDTMAELAASARLAALDRNAGIADCWAAFHEAKPDERAKLFVEDKVHLSAAGQARVAAVVREAIMR